MATCLEAEIKGLARVKRLPIDVTEIVKPTSFKVNVRILPERQCRTIPRSLLRRIGYPNSLSPYSEIENGAYQRPCCHHKDYISLVIKTKQQPRGTQQIWCVVEVAANYVVMRGDEDCWVPRQNAGEGGGYSVAPTTELNPLSRAEKEKQDRELEDAGRASIQDVNNLIQQEKQKDKKKKKKKEKPKKSTASESSSGHRRDPPSSAGTVH